MTSLLKKPSPSPPTISAAVHTCCKCNLCTGRSLSPKQRNHRAKENDLEDLVYSLVMLIIEGRAFNTSHNEGVHANFLVENLTKKVMKINQAAQGLCDSKFLAPSNKSTDQIRPYLETNCHECSNSENMQCRVAAKLKYKLEKCVRDHLSTEKLLNETDSDLSSKQPIFSNSLSSLKKVHQSPQLPESFHSPFDSPTLAATNNDRFTNSTFNNSFLTNKFSSSNCSSPDAFLPTASTNIIVNVFLLPACCFNEHINNSGGILLDSDTFDYELLESWTISMITNQKNDQSKNQLLTLNQLFQAIRSYLHFSQISSWINQSKGKLPRNIGYSITYSTDKQTSSLSNSPVEEASSNQSSNQNFDFQTFPSLYLLLSSNKFYVNQQASSANRFPLTSTHLKVNLLSRKRANNQQIPQVNCPKDHQNFNETDSHESSTVIPSNSSRNSVTQPITIVSSIKMAAKEFGFSQHSNESHNFENAELNKTYFLPHWSPINTTIQITNDNEDHTQDLSTKFSTLTQNAIPTHQIPLNVSNLKQCSVSPTRFQQTPTNPSLIDTYNNVLNNPITTPTSFPHSKLAFNTTADTSTTVTSSSSLLPSTHNPNNLLISQSPQVLVSNHRLVSDLCSVTQNQLSLTSNLDKVMGKSNDLNKDHDQVDSNLTNINKRKYFHEIDSECDQSFEKRYDTDNECQFEPSPSSGYLCPKVSTTRATSLTIKTTENQLNVSDSEESQQDKHLSFNVNNINIIKPVLISTTDHTKNLLSNDQLILNNNVCKIIINNENNNSNDEYNEDVVANSDVNNNELTPLGTIVNNEEQSLRKLAKYSNIKFTQSNLPLSSSPAPVRKSGSSLFDFDNSLKNPRSIRNALSSNLLNNKKSDSTDESIENSSNSVTSTSVVETSAIDKTNMYLSTSKSYNKLKRETFTRYNKNFQSFNSRLSFSNAALNSIPLTPNCLLGSFEESLLNGRMNPVGVVDGFYAEIGASGSFFPEHATLPVHAAFYQVCEDIAASPYLGVINLGSLGKRGYKVPNKGTIQVTLFNPNNSVIKMFVVMYDLSDMPPGHRTFLRQRTMYVPLVSNSNSGSGSNSNSKTVKGSNGHVSKNEDDFELKSYLRYLIHLRFATSKSGKMYLHTNIKLVFARNKCEIDPRLAKYEYKTFTEAPKNPRYSPRK